MTLEDSERPIQLLEHYHTRQFMGQSHLPQRKGEISLPEGISGEAVRPANGEDQRERIAVLVVAKEGRQFFGGKRLAARVDHDQPGSRAPAIAARELQQSRFILERRTRDFSILAQAFEVIIGQGLDGGILGLSDPGNSELHGKEILTAEARKLAPRTRKNANFGTSAPNPEASGYGFHARLRTGRGAAARRRDFAVSSESSSFFAVRQSRSRS